MAMDNPSFDDQIRAAFSSPVDCAARVGRVVPGIDFEGVCQDIDAMGVDVS
jgi:hypothetical protein